MGEDFIIREYIMKKLAIYGKGGIGKSTTTSNLAAAFARTGKRVIQIGCDPKADSTMNLLGGKPLMPVMDYYREYTEAPDFEHIGAYGFGHVFCMETGGPTPGLGCAGRGIIATFDLIDELEVFEKINPEIVLYDVLGDVVCGGFSAPIRDGYAEEVCIVTSGEKMSLYAARGYASVKGLILNRRNVEDEYERVKAFADERKLPILADIPRSKEIQVWEDRGMTVIEGEPDSEISIVYRQLAQRLLGDE